VTDATRGPVRRRDAGDQRRGAAEDGRRTRSTRRSCRATSEAGIGVPFGYSGYFAIRGHAWEVCWNRASRSGRTAGSRSDDGPTCDTARPRAVDQRPRGRPRSGCCSSPPASRDEDAADPAGQPGRLGPQGSAARPRDRGRRIRGPSRIEVRTNGRGTDPRSGRRPTITPTVRRPPGPSLNDSQVERRAPGHGRPISLMGVATEHADPTFREEVDNGLEGGIHRPSPRSPGAESPRPGVGPVRPCGRARPAPMTARTTDPDSDRLLRRLSGPRPHRVAGPRSLGPGGEGGTGPCPGGFAGTIRIDRPPDPGFTRTTADPFE
jgi:hypothetical protein